MKKSNPISIDLLRKLLRYESETGKLFWFPRTSDLFSRQQDCDWWNARYANKEAFTSMSEGYFHGTILRETYSAHRVIWALVRGYWPDEVDHESLDRSDNRIGNLRDVSLPENLKNKRNYSTNKSGVPGVVWQKDVAKWAVRIGSKNRIHLGCFSTKAEAIAVRKAAEIEHGYHPNHGKPRPVTTRHMAPSPAMAQSERRTD